MTYCHCIISCDIVAHSDEDDNTQVEQIVSLNNCIKLKIKELKNYKIYWASRGDGGHIVIESLNWSFPSICIINALVRWSKINNKALRVIGHVGYLDLFHGADDRIELAGPSINLIGKMSRLFVSGQVFVTKMFAENFDHDSFDGILFHNPFEIFPEYFEAQEIFFLSVKGEFRSAVFDKTFSYDKDFLQNKSGTDDPWKCIYKAKRLMQLNSDDKIAVRTLEQINPLSLSYVDRSTGEREPNPFVANLNGLERVQFVRAAQLVERNAGEILCEFEDEGDTMYLILEGAVAVIDPNTKIPMFVLRSGEIVGELAFALRKKRTATLMCVGPTSLLSFNLDVITSILKGSVFSGNSYDKIHSFLNERVARYICMDKGFFVGNEQNGPLAFSNSHIRKPWERFASYDDISFNMDANPFVTTNDEEFRRGGVYILLSGRMTNRDIEEKVFEDNMPIIHCQIPGHIITPFTRYAINSDVSIMRIPMENLVSFGSEIRLKIIDRIKKEMTKLRYYDVFLSYSLDDYLIAERWKSRMERDGLTVYMDDPGDLGTFTERIPAAIRDALTFVVLVSAHGDSGKWVAREVRFRQKIFDSHENIIPVKLLGGKPEEIAHGKVSIDGSRIEEEEVIKQVLNEIWRAKSGYFNPVALMNKPHLMEE